jgi:hypothetical protein
VQMRRAWNSMHAPAEKRGGTENPSYTKLTYLAGFIFRRIRDPQLLGSDRLGENRASLRREEGGLGGCTISKTWSQSALR